jgi:hypothetical protein
MGRIVLIVLKCLREDYNEGYDRKISIPYISGIS